MTRMDDNERIAQERLEAERREFELRQQVRLERIRQEVEAERQRLAEWAQARKNREERFERPAYADAVNSLALRHASERMEMHDAQKEALEDRLKAADKSEGEEREAQRHEIRKALEQKFREQQLRLEQEQIERADQLALAYGQVKGKDRER